MEFRELAPVFSSALQDEKNLLISTEAAKRARLWRFSPIVVWVFACVTVLVWSLVDKPGWDVSVTYKAITDVQAGRDPYAKGIAALTQYREEMRQHSNTEPPFIYVYPPITIPALRAVALLPGWFSRSLYWFAYIASTLILLWVGLQFVEPAERSYLKYFTPVAVFFPGLLANGTFLSGNIAIILYAGIFLAAIYGWKHGDWRWLYIVALLASCVKGPFLLFVALPVLSARKQWLNAIGTVGAGLALVQLQSRIWPIEFNHYLESIGFMFTLSRDFGCSPAGLLADFLARRGLPFVHASTVFYASYTVAIFILLFYLSERYLRRKLPLTRWAPILLTGIALMNPRLIEYDLAPITIPAALILRRLTSSIPISRRLIWFVSIFLVGANCLGVYSWELRKWLDGPLLVFIFAVGYADSIADRVTGQEMQSSSPEVSQKCA